MNEDDDLFKKLVGDGLQYAINKPLTLEDLQKTIDLLEPPNKSDTFYIEPNHMPLMPVVPGVTEHTGSFPAKSIQIKERYGVGLINGNGVAVAKDIQMAEDKWKTPEYNINEVLLLQRKMGDIEFTDEQLIEFMHESKAEVFDVDRLIWKVGNTQIPQEHHGKHGMPTKLWLEPAGIFANLRVKPKPSFSMGKASPELLQKQFHIEGVIVQGKYEPVIPPEQMWMNSETAVHISDEMIQDSQWDLLGNLIKKAGQQMARVTEQELLATITKPGEINQNGRVYTTQTLNRAMLADDADIGSGSDQ